MQHTECISCSVDTHFPPLCVCLQVVFGMRQQYGADNITMVNGTAARVRGPLTIRLLVLNGSTNASSNGTRNSSTGELRLHNHGNALLHACGTACYACRGRAMVCKRSCRTLQFHIVQQQRMPQGAGMPLGYYGG